MTREQIEGAILLCSLVGVVIVTIAMIFFPPPAGEPAPWQTPAPTLFPYNFPDWEICWDGCCVTQADFESLCKERADGRE
jgi:hypothetical protein